MMSMAQCKRDSSVLISNKMADILQTILQMHFVECKLLYFTVIQISVIFVLKGSIVNKSALIPRLG